jgi:hypothetical protein
MLSGQHAPNELEQFHCVDRRTLVQYRKDPNRAVMALDESWRKIVAPA